MGRPDRERRPILSLTPKKIKPEKRSGPIRQNEAVNIVAAVAEQLLLDSGETTELQRFLAAVEDARNVWSIQARHEDLTFRRRAEVLFL